MRVQSHRKSEYVAMDWCSEGVRTASLPSIFVEIDRPGQADVNPPFQRADEKDCAGEGSAPCHQACIANTLTGLDIGRVLAVGLPSRGALLPCSGLSRFLA